jgi:hypothetical protein
MTVAPIRAKPDAIAELVVAVRALTAVERATTEVRAMRATQRKQSLAAVPKLLGALLEDQGTGNALQLMHELHATAPAISLPSASCRTRN